MSCVTLLSDFGLNDPSVAVAKAIIGKHVPSTSIADISHSLEPSLTHQAAYFLLSSYRAFPAGSCHVVMFNVFSERNPRLLLCEHKGHFFLAPDNGVLSLAFGENLDKVWQVYTLEDAFGFKDWLDECGKLLAALQTKSATELGLQKTTLKTAPKKWQPVHTGDSVECHVIHIDRFNNVVVSLTQHEFERFRGGRDFKIKFSRTESVTKLSSHYSSVPSGEKLCRFNSAGFLEICINGNGAAKLFGLKVLAAESIVYNTIKIEFS